MLLYILLSIILAYNYYNLIKQSLFKEYLQQ